MGTHRVSLPNIKKINMGISECKMPASSILQSVGGYTTRLIMLDNVVCIYTVAKCRWLYHPL